MNEGTILWVSGLYPLRVSRAQAYRWLLTRLDVAQRRGRYIDTPNANRLTADRAVTEAAAILISDEVYNLNGGLHVLVTFAAMKENERLFALFSLVPLAPWIVAQRKEEER